MRARRLTTLLPAMSLAEALETTWIHRLAGRTGDCTALATTQPFCALHHTISDVGLIAGGHVPMPKEVSLAQNGVLFLDEPPEFRRQVLEVLCQPLEDNLTSMQSRPCPRRRHAGHAGLVPQALCGSSIRSWIALEVIPKNGQWHRSPTYLYSRRHGHSPPPQGKYAKRGRPAARSGVHRSGTNRSASSQKAG